jgi:hypothetical protein
MIFVSVLPVVGGLTGGGVTTEGEVKTVMY